MQTGTIFLAGVYGVGKSTVCQKLSATYNLSVYSASDLISCVNDEQYGKNKLVTDLDNNQMILCRQVKRILASEPMIILAGHFCILGEDNEVVSIPDEIYKELRITKIVLLEADTNIIKSNLHSRDKTSYSKETVMALSIAERAKARSIAKELEVPLLIKEMRYSDCDIREIYELICQGEEYESFT